MSGSALRQSSYVVITDRCPIETAIEGDDYVEIRCGGASRDQNFEFVLHREALRTIVTLGTDALHRMDGATPADNT